MTNTSDKFSGGGGDSRPLPQIPGFLGRREENSKNCKLPIENCLTVGVQSEFQGPTGVQNLAFLRRFRGSHWYKGNRINGT